VARNRAVLDLGRALADGDGIDDLAAPLLDVPIRD
jgi:hypothetical protein